MARVLLISIEMGWDGLLLDGLQAQDHDVRVVEPSVVATEIARWRPEVVVSAVGAGDGAAGTVRNLRAGTDAALVAVVRDADFLTLVDLYDAGADDCLVLPVSVDRLIDSVEALAGARAVAVELQVAPRDRGSDMGLATEAVNGRTGLLPIERRIFVALSQHAGRPVTRQRLLYEVWGPGRGGEDSLLRLYLGVLGRKLSRQPAGTARIAIDAGGLYRLGS